MWLELTDGHGRRIVVNMALVVALRQDGDGKTRLETVATVGGAIHAVVVSESLEDVMRLMENAGAAGSGAGEAALAEATPDFVSDGNEG